MPQLHWEPTYLAEKRRKNSFHGSAGLVNGFSFHEFFSAISGKDMEKTIHSYEYVVLQESSVSGWILRNCNCNWTSQPHDHIPSCSLQNECWRGKNLVIPRFHLTIIIWLFCQLDVIIWLEKVIQPIFPSSIITEVTSMDPNQWKRFLLQNHSPNF